MNDTPNRADARQPAASLPSFDVSGGAPAVAGASAGAAFERRQPADLAEILERVLNTGIVIAGEIRIDLLDIELLTIKLRLIITSLDRAEEIGLDWWKGDAWYSGSVESKDSVVDLVRESADDEGDSRRDGDGDGDEDGDGRDAQNPNDDPGVLDGPDRVDPSAHPLQTDDGDVVIAETVVAKAARRRKRSD